MMKNLIQVFSVASITFLAGVIIGSSIPSFSTAFAWETSQSAKAVCVLNPNVNINYVNIEVTFTNKDNKGINVVAQDNWTGQKVDLGNVEVNQTKTGLIKTGQKSIGSNTVTFHLKWADGSDGKETFKSSYSALECEQPVSPTPTPTSTPKPTSTPTPTKTPAPTVAPTATPIPTSTPAPTSAPQQVINNNAIAEANATANVELTVNQVQPTQAPQVLAASAIKELPKTGPQDAILLGLLSFLPAGLFIRNKAESLLKGL